MAFELLATHRRNAVPPACSLSGATQVAIAIQAMFQGMPLVDDRLVVAAQVTGLQLGVEQVDGGTRTGQGIRQTAILTHAMSQGTLRQHLDSNTGVFLRLGAGGEVKMQDFVQCSITWIELVGEAQSDIRRRIQILLMSIRQGQRAGTLGAAFFESGEVIDASLKP